jgi:hypothetical protein
MAVIDIDLGTRARLRIYKNKHELKSYSEAIENLLCKFKENKNARMSTIAGYKEKSNK